MNIYNPSITELDEVYDYYEAGKHQLPPPLGVQVGWNYRELKWPTMDEVEDSTEFQRLEWARFCRASCTMEMFKSGDRIIELGWENMDSMINSMKPLTPKQQLQLDGEIVQQTDSQEGMTNDEVDELTG